MIEAYLKLEDILGVLGPIKVRGVQIDGFVNATVIHHGTDKLYIEDLNIVGWELIISGERISVNNLGFELENEVINRLKDLARELAIKSPEKYWEYRRV